MILKDGERSIEFTHFRANACNYLPPELPLFVPGRRMTLAGMGSSVAFLKKVTTGERARIF